MSSKRCEKCSTNLSRTTKGDLCGTCYRNRNKDDVPQPVDAPGNINLLSDIVSVKKLEKLPALSENWLTESSSNLSGGQLLKIITHANNALFTEIRRLNSVVGKLKGDIDSSQIEKQSNEIENLKKVILNQQTFIEASQRKQLANNCIISGIPNDDIVWGKRTITKS